MSGTTVFMQFVNAFFAFLTTIFSGWVGFQMFKLRMNYLADSVKLVKATTEVKDTLKEATASVDKKLDENTKITLDSSAALKIEVDSIKKTGAYTNRLINGGMSNVLRLSQMQAHQLAELTKSKVHIEAAALADKMLEEHLRIEEDAKLNPVTVVRVPSDMETLV